MNESTGDIHNEELLSAYLDDEVTAEERAQVERLLAEREDYRQLLHEMQGVRQTLSVLPPLKLTAEQARQILLAADREIENHLAAEIAPVSLGEPSERWMRPFRGWRIWVWPAVAATAASVIALLDSGKAPQQVALDPATGQAVQAVPLDARELEARAERGVVSADRVAGDAPPDRPAAPQEMLKRAPEEMTVVADTEPTPHSAENVLIVTCVQSPDAAARRDFDQLLLSNSITVETTPNPVEPAAGESVVADIAADEASAEAKDQVTPAQPEAAAEVVYVEATPDQLQAALSQLAANQKSFLCVEVIPAANEKTQAAWTQFNRAANPGVGYTNLDQAPHTVLTTSPDALPPRQVLEQVRSQNALVPQAANLQNASRAQRVQNLKMPNLRQQPQPQVVLHGKNMDSAQSSPAFVASEPPIMKSQAAPTTQAPVERQTGGQPLQRALFYLRTEGSPAVEPQAAPTDR
jgi:hypothetical protein